MRCLSALWSIVCSLPGFLAAQASPTCHDFEELPEGAVYEFSAAGFFFDGGVRFDAWFYYNLTGFAFDGTITVSAAGRAGGSGRELRLTRATVALRVECAGDLRVRFGQFAPGVNLEFNGESVFAETMAELDGRLFGGTTVRVASEPVAGGEVGYLRLEGAAEGLFLGGADLSLDAFCYGPCPPIIVRAASVVSSSPLSATEQRVVVRARIENAGQVFLQYTEDLDGAERWRTIPSVVTRDPADPARFQFEATLSRAAPVDFFRVMATY
jgi:hypothetical protein